MPFCVPKCSGLLRFALVCFGVSSPQPSFSGHDPSTAGTFWKKFQKNSGKTLENALRAFPGSPLESTAGIPHDSRRLQPKEHFQTYLPISTAGDASFFRIGSGEGLLELLMEFPAVLRAFLFCPQQVPGCQTMWDEEKVVCEMAEGSIQQTCPTLSLKMFKELLKSLIDDFSNQQISMKKERQLLNRRSWGNPFQLLGGRVLSPVRREVCY